jgi:hypothetical protein
MPPLIPTLSLQVTYQCNIECGHCGPYCGPHEKDWMSVDEIRDLITQASELGAFNVVFTGGEPTLLGRHLPELLRFIREQTRIQSTRLVTNGKWANTPERAEHYLSMWKEAGLTELNISCGEYHQQFVPIEFVANGYRVAKRLGYKTVLLAGEFLAEGKGKYSPRDFARAVGEPLMPLDAMSPFIDEYRGMQCGSVMRFGRGADVVPEDAVMKRPEAAHKSRCFEVLKAITAHPNGNLTACCGVMVRQESLLNIGNWRTERLSAILERAHDDRVLNWIRYVGLKDMRRWLQQKDPNLRFATEHTSICDLCAEVVYNPRCQELLLEHGHERDGDIIANKVAVDGIMDDVGAFVYSPDGSAIPGTRRS